MSSTKIILIYLLVTLIKCLAFGPDEYFRGQPETSCCKLKWVDLKDKSALLTAINVTTGLILGPNSVECWFALRNPIEYTFVKADLSPPSSPLNFQVLANPYDCPVRWIDLSTQKFFLQKPKLFFLPEVNRMFTFSRAFSLHSDGKSLLDSAEFYGWPIIKSPIEFVNLGPIKFGKEFNFPTRFFEPFYPSAPSLEFMDPDNFRLSRHFMFVNCTQVLEDKIALGLHDIQINEGALLAQSFDQEAKFTNVSKTGEKEKSWKVTWTGTRRFSFELNLTRALPFTGAKKDVENFLNRNLVSPLYSVYKNCSRNLISLLEMKNHTRANSSSELLIHETTKFDPVSNCKLKSTVKRLNAKLPVNVIFELTAVQGEEEAIDFNSMTALMRQENLQVEKEDARLLVTISGHLDVDLYLGDKFNLTCQSN